MEEAKKLFGNQVVIRLFGSRVNNQAKGGDIDLLIDVPDKRSSKTDSVLRYNSRLQQKLGEQKIDIIALPETQNYKNIHKEALRTGVVL